MKNKFMQMIVGTFLGILLLVSVTQILVFGQEDEIQGQQAQGIVGVWQTVVTPRNCQTGAQIAPAFQGLLTFNEGGTLAEFAAGSSPSLRSPGHGVWETGNGLRPALASNAFNFTAAFNFIRFNPDGTFAGRNTVRQTVTFGPSGNEFTTTGTVEVFAPNGNLIAIGCSTSTATRFE